MHTYVRKILFSLCSQQLELLDTVSLLQVEYNNFVLQVLSTTIKVNDTQCDGSSPMQAY